MSATRTTLTTGSLLVLAVLFVALTILNNHFLRGVRLDLTENNLFTLSEGSRNILSSIDEPINLYFFYSERASRGIPVLRTYATRVRELLEEFVQVSNRQLQLHIIDPLPFSEEEDRAAQFGLQSIPVGAANENVYFGLAGTNSTDGLSIVPFFQPDKEAFLEYDLTKLVYNLANPKKPVVALISSLPINGGFDPMTRQPSQPWVIYEQMQPLFDLRILGGDLDKIDDDVGVLMVVHPKNLSEKTQYAIDQYILGGGHAIIFVDPQAELETPANPNDPSGMFAEKSSNLEKIFAAWGIDYNKDQILGDSGYALSVTVSEGQAPVRHLGILSIEKSGLDSSDVISADLSTVNVAMSGFFKLADDSPNGSKLSLTPLIQSSTFAAPIEASKARFVPDPAELAKGFQETGERYIIAARLSGEAASAFPDGAPKPEGEESQSDTTESTEPGTKSDHLTQGSINVILVADTDILTDRLWVRSQNFFGQRLVSAWANNGDFVVNAVDNLLGNSDLISMRSRATSSRPFTTVQALERQADAQFRAKEQELLAELQETEAKLNELQQNRQDQDVLQSLILTPEQQAEIEKFQQRKLEIRKDLRQVRRDLDRGIESLGNWLKFINIGLIPILLSVLALIMALVVRSRRQRAMH